MTVTDNTGASDKCPFEVNVIDKTRPKITCPENIATNTSQKRCFAIVNSDVTATDNCNGSKTELIKGHTNKKYRPGIYTVTYRATDVGNNTDECSFNVTVTHDQGPVITCANTTFVLNATGNTTVGNCTAPMINVTGGIVSAEDTCYIQNLMQNIAIGALLNASTTPYNVTITATDTKGNSANKTCSFIVSNATCT